MGNTFGGRKRWIPADILSGWGLVCIAFTLGGIFLPPALSAITVGLGFLTLFVVRRQLLQRDYNICPPWLMIAIGLQLGVLALINLAGITTWDEIATWSPSAIYLWRHDTFPHTNLEDSYSRWPAYPYGMAYLGYAASFLYSSFITQSGSMATWLLFACFGWAITETQLQPASPDQKVTHTSKLAWLGLALLLCTLFNPGFNASFSVSGASDGPTAIVTGFLGLLLVHLHAAFTKRDQERVSSISAQLALAAVVYVLLRQINIIPLFILSFGFLVLAIKDKFFKSGLLTLGIALIPAVIARLLWQHYVDQNLPGGAVGLMPFNQWRWNMLPDLLGAIGEDMAEKWGFYLLMLATSITGLVGFFRPSNSTRTLNFITATAFFGYTSFLVLAYVACDFTDRDVKRASSFYRYSSHMGMLGIASLWFIMRPWLEQRLKEKHFVWLAIFGLTITPLIYTLKPNWVVRHSRPEYCTSRELAKKLLRHCPRKAK